MDRNHSVQPTADADASLMRALDEYLQAVKAGTAPSQEEFLARHSHLAGELRECLASLAFIRRASPAVSNVADVPEQREVPAPAALGDYRIVREVGRGGMGVVYEAEQISLGRRVALKVLPFAATMDPRQLQRFHNEARSVASLHHEHIVPIYAVACERGVHFYAMQFINGRTLAELIGQQHSGDEPTTAFKAASPDADTAAIAAARTGQAPRDPAYCPRVVEWGIQAAEALEHAHSLGIVHRDVKPGNLMIDAQGKLWVTDFGLARTVTDAGLTMTGDMLGTLRYMSPEQALAKHGLVDHRSDVYALGVTLYEVLTGRPAVEGADSQEILNNIALAEPRSPRKLNPAVPIDLETVILKALAKEPSERYESARELADDLARVRDDHAILARRPSIGQRLFKLLRRNRRVAGFAAAAVALVVIALAASAVYATAAYRSESAERQRAELAVEDAELAATKERDQRRAAEVALAAAAKQRRFARQAVNDMYTEVAESLLSQQPGMGEVRKRFLLKALTYYEQFADEDSKEPEVQVEIIRANMRVGRIQWLMQQNEGADAAYGRAFSRAEALAADTPPKREYQELLALACFERSFVSLSLGKNDDALSLRRRSLKLYEQLASDHPEVAEYRRAGVHVCSRLASLMHNLPEGEAIGRTALGLAERLLVDFPGEPDFRKELGFACLDLGNILIGLGRHADAQPILGRALEVWEDMVRRHPADSENQAHAAWSAQLLGSLYARIREKGQARQYYQKAFVRYRKLVVEHPEVPVYQSEVLQVASHIVNLSPSKKDRYEVSQGVDELLGCRDIQSVLLVLRASSLVNDFARYAGQDPELSLDARETERKQHMVRAESIWQTYQAKLAEAIRLRPTDPELHYNLGVTLYHKRRLDDAIAEFQETIRLKKDYPDAHYYLGHSLTAKSRANGQMRLFASAARLYQQAVASNPSLLAEYSGSEDPYNAACAAAQAGCGQGDDAAKLDAAERGRWRRQALEWLRADLTLWTKQLEGDDIQRRGYARRNLQQWQRASALEGVRGPAGLAQLPEAERAEWRRFWAEVKAAAEAPTQQQKLPKPEAPAPGK